MMQSDLIENLKVVLGQVKPSNKEEILSACHFLDTFLTENKSQLDKKLAHYLAKRSYQKAMDHLEASGDHG